MEYFNDTFTNETMDILECIIQGQNGTQKSETRKVKRSERAGASNCEDQISFGATLSETSPTIYIFMDC